MVWETRQNRLKGLFGAPEELCFQVFVEVYQRTADPEKFDALCEEHGLTVDDDNPARYLPRHKIGEVDFRPGLLLFTREGDKEVCEVNVQTLFTTMDQDLIRAVKSQYDDDGHVCFSNDALDQIMHQYIPEIERRFPELSFEDKRYADIGKISVEFSFAIQPYDYDIHPPRDMDVLKPLKINDQLIEPAAQRIKAFSMLKAPNPK